MARTPSRGATLDTVAARAGVSKATASKVLNGRPGTSEATRARVEEAIRELGYAPSTARGRGPDLAATSGAGISVVFDTLVSLYSLRVLEGMIAGGQRVGAHLVPGVLVPGGSAADRIVLDAAFVRSAAQQGHIGIIAVTSEVRSDVIEACAAEEIALVAVDAPNPLDSSVVSIGSNHWAGGLQATEHLLSLGHRRIAFVGGDTRNPGLRARFGGYREALMSAGIADDAALVSETGMMSSETAVGPMMALSDPPTAFFATNDADAFAAIRGLYALGLRVPHDVSVIGYDDTYASIPTAPLLSTVHTPMHDIGRMAVDTVLGMHAGHRPISHHIELATSLVVRESTAPHPRSASASLVQRA